MTDRKSPHGVAIALIVGAASCGLALGALGPESLVSVLALAALPLVILVGTKLPEAIVALFLAAGSYVIPGPVPLDTGYYFGFVLLVVAVGVLKEHDSRLSGVVWLLLAAVSIVLVSFVYGGRSDYAVDKFIRVAISIPLCVMGALVVARQKSAFRRFVGWLVAIGAALSLIAFALNPPWQMTERLMAFGGSPITLGRLAGFAILGGLAALASRWWSHWLSIPAVVMCVAALLLSGSRGPLVALVLAFSVVLVVQLVSARLRAGALAGQVLIAGAAAAVMTVGGGTLLVQRLSLLVSGDPGASAHARNTLFAEAVSMISTMPLTGVGLGRFGETGSHRYPHNLLLEVGAESGLAAVTLMGVFLAFAILAALKVLVRDGEGRGYFLVGGLLFGVINALVSGDLNNNFMLFTLAIVSILVSEDSRMHVDEGNGTVSIRTNRRMLS